MDEVEYQQLKAKFLSALANVPLPLHKEIIAVLDDETPISWRSAFAEVKADGKNARTILQHLKDIGLIK